MEIPFCWRPGKNKFFTFKGEDLDATFIELTSDIIDMLNKSGAFWMSMHNSETREGDPTFILQHPAEISRGGAALAIGKVGDIQRASLWRRGSCLQTFCVY